MAILILLALVVLSFIAFWSSQYRTGYILLVYTIVYIIGVGNGYLPEYLLKSIQTKEYVAQPIWQTNNAIVVLGAGTVRWSNSLATTSSLFGYSRVLEAARLYFSCKKMSSYCRVIPSGGDVTKSGTAEAEIIAGELKSLGVVETDITLEAHSANTYQNAQNVSAITTSGKFDRIYLVTSGFHMTRAMLFFNFFNVAVEPAPSDQMKAVSSRIPMGYNFTLTDLALHEYVGLLRFAIYNKLGWNSK